MRYALTCSVILMATLTAAADELNWPQFRGLTGGVSENKNLPKEWNQKTNIAWKTDVPGRGWASPIVWQDRIFLTSVISDGDVEKSQKGLYFGGERLKAPTAVHHWMVYCFDSKTGKKLWDKEVHKGVPVSTHHIKNNLAPETPVTDGERVYAYFGNLGVWCYTVEGKEVWSQKWESYKTRNGWGTGASPALHKGRLYIVNDNEEKSFLVALEAKSGKEIWRVERDERSNWATPFIWENDKRTEIVTCGSKKIRSYDLDGKVLWEMDGMSSIAIPTPVAKHGLLYVSSGYILDRKRPVFAIKPGASDDISLKDNEEKNDFVVWSQKLAGPYNPSPIVYGDKLYVLYDRGFIACYDAKTGKEIYDKTRIGPGASAFTVSPWAYDNQIFCLSEDGDTYVIQAGAEFKLLGRNPLEEMCMATPAITGNGLIVRTLSKLYRIQDGAGQR